LSLGVTQDIPKNCVNMPNRGSLAREPAPSARCVHGGRDFGRGYTYLAIVAETQPITHPRKTSRKTPNLSFLIVTTNAKMTIQTRAQPMLYAV
jgi:hypothetical protein